MPPPLRVALFAPGDAPDKMAKAVAAGADAVIFDLEDAVADPRKVPSRALVAEALSRRQYTGPPLIVRVNAAATGLLVEDLAAVARPNLAAVMVPKVEDADALADVADALAVLRPARAIAGEPVGLIALIESSAGVAACERIAAEAPRSTWTLAFGGVDYCADLGIEFDLGGEGLLHARARVALAARAAGLAPALDGPVLALGDEALLRDDSARSRRLGFGGRLVIHPRQIAAVREAYGGLDDAGVRRARAIVAAFEAAQREGRAVAVVDGEFVDPPVYRRALDQLASAGIAVRPGG
ncbi:MAG TPA: aldolase/citrate lyase family protein [Solirubrobacteraceae bacterium]|nr:aldolase/citrate lyase family protein [Solirubrobacteraceae bacterium]